MFHRFNFRVKTSRHSGINAYICDIIQTSMAANLQQRVDKIEAKAALILERYELMLRARQEAENRVRELTGTVERLERTIGDLNRQIEYLKVASVLTPDHRDVEATRAVLSELVREIDKCINQLSI
ncbi:MAG: DUF3450 domain-containing protein [Duncaniella sp.]|uniref:hypothetical protein n=1 Tax=Duncaniella sp. TaxID=2518496 RepID=UPI0023C51490|nr:hypothetical protein [Duncaniella sp.]MDE5988671.1 DUF3450 domain-containing protein [Duncaniella sp.]